MKALRKKSNYTKSEIIFFKIPHAKILSVKVVAKSANTFAAGVLKNEKITDFSLLNSKIKEDFRLSIKEETLIGE